jgi:hypothetical protein
MPIEIKYYKFTDPNTSKESKGMGFIYTCILHKTKASILHGYKTVISDEAVEKTIEIKPNVESSVEIDKTEYGGITLVETAAQTKKREKEELRVAEHIKHLQDREATPAERVAMRNAKQAGKMYKATISTVAVKDKPNKSTEVPL